MRSISVTGRAGEAAGATLSAWSASGRRIISAGSAGLAARHPAPPGGEQAPEEHQSCSGSLRPDPIARGQRPGTAGAATITAIEADEKKTSVGTWALASTRTDRQRGAHQLTGLRLRMVTGSARPRTLSGRVAVSNRRVGAAALLPVLVAGLPVRAAWQVTVRQAEQQLQARLGSEVRGPGLAGRAVSGLPLPRRRPWPRSARPSTYRSADIVHIQRP